ncbi:MAG: hypothetical protein EAZ18_11870 [Oscillatoriales cyanobacterium]|nr:MAG: hypothetical protein EAZ18_11870 [Oscillatoriales cyanobacterium]
MQNHLVPDIAVVDDTAFHLSQDVKSCSRVKHNSPKPFLEVSIDRASCDRDFKTLEYRYDRNDDSERIEVVLSRPYCLNMNDLEAIQ